MPYVAQCSATANGVSNSPLGGVCTLPLPSINIIKFIICVFLVVL